MNLISSFRYVLVISAIGFYTCQVDQSSSTDWCDQSIRLELQELKEIRTDSKWFKVYDVGTDVYAIAEPFNYQEVISYLIIGSEKALLFDTGNGFESMSNIVHHLTTLPITVINSHSHYDHIGGNYEFDQILAFENEYTLHWANEGWSHEMVKSEVRPAALCIHKLPGIDTSTHRVRPFKISRFVEDGDIIDLGDRSIQIISVPGHTPDAMALLEKETGYMWTGDTYYEAAIWLYFEGTDLDAYKTSIHKLASMSSYLERVFPAHNTAIAEPTHLSLAAKAFDDILGGNASPIIFDKYNLPVNTDAVEFEFDHFSFLIRRDHLTARGLNY